MKNQTLAFTLFAVIVFIGLKMLAIALKDTTQWIPFLVSMAHLCLTASAAYLFLRKKES